MSKNMLRCLTLGAIALVAAPSMAVDQEFYELRIYRNSDAAKQAAVLEYLDSALVPALNRMGVNTVGVLSRPAVSLKCR